MIEKAYIDTCILAAYYCPEPNSNHAEKLLLSVKQPIISLLTELELFSVISKKIRNHELKKQNAQKIINNYNTHIKENYYQKTVLKLEHYSHARDLLSVLSYSLHTLDAIHLAIAFAENLPLVTFDQKFAKTALKIPILVFS